MSKMAAVDTAVRLQMAEDGREAFYLYVLGPSTSAPALNGYALTDTQIENFFYRVADRLKLDMPAFDLPLDNLKAAECRDRQMHTLIRKMAALAKEVK